MLHSFRLVLEGKAGKEMPESPRYEFLERFLANNFALSDVEGKTTAPLNRIGIVDLPLLSNSQFTKSPEPIFWEVIDSCLKLVSVIFYQIFIFHQMIALQKLQKILFISSKKLFSFSRYSNCCISISPSFSPCRPLLKRLIEDKSHSL